MPPSARQTQLQGEILQLQGEILQQLQQSHQHHHTMLCHILDALGRIERELQLLRTSDNRQTLPNAIQIEGE